MEVVSGFKRMANAINQMQERVKCFEQMAMASAAAPPGSAANQRLPTRLGEL